ncbi:polysaccharide biosynthesis/export family protein [Sulfuriferula plumbiphila]|uniref:polysaccharide biosynthesis/export family protein n=1 Tax=Sulfuriferula plumbiphila TaxID=171865 RepID=UPI001CB8B6F6|nr:polysaccharide biosynthesis/export family protein [Sulfuriferula plumbiphila]
MKTIKNSTFGGVRSLFATAVAAGILGGCATYPSWIPSSGPSREQVLEHHDTKGIDGIQVVDVDEAVARKLLANQKKTLFSDSFGGAVRSGYLIGAGDVIEVSVWEAPPATLFGGVAIDPRTGPATTRVTTFPEQMVSSDGMINIPFAGLIASAGRTPEQIEGEIAQRLKGKANQPQVLVRVIHNNTANVTVVGEVASSTRMPLTARGERLLDALAAAGGVRQSVNKMTLQVTRGDKVQALPLDTIIRDPKQNIVLQPGDVITALYQPLSFTVLGATGKNEEINFEAQGISLAQALARAGGLQDARADARAVFVFRFEDSKALDWATPPKITPDGKVPVIYQVDLKDPASFFVAQSFPVDNKDVLYVSNAPGADLQKFLNIVLSAAYPIINVINLKPAGL